MTRSRASQGPEAALEGDTKNALWKKKKCAVCVGGWGLGSQEGQRAELLLGKGTGVRKPGAPRLPTNQDENRGIRACQSRGPPAVPWAQIPRSWCFSWGAILLQFHAPSADCRAEIYELDSETLPTTSDNNSRPPKVNVLLFLSFGSQWSKPGLSDFLLGVGMLRASGKAEAFST